MIEKKVIVIVGPTGSGKTGLAVDVALRLGGEVISADSRALYKGMDIGTAKPSLAEMRGVRHWGINLVEPGERFTVADFKEYTLNAIMDIRRRGKVPIIAGGTGLYVDAVIYDYQFGDVVKKTYSDRQSIGREYDIVGIWWEKDELRERLGKRANKLFTQALEKETQVLAEKYGWESQAMKSNIYPIVWKKMNGEIDMDEAKRLFVLDDWHLAKRQMTWFRRNSSIKWMGLDEARKYLYNVGDE